VKVAEGGVRAVEANGREVARLIVGLVAQVIESQPRGVVVLGRVTECGGLQTGNCGLRGVLVTRQGEEDADPRLFVEAPEHLPDIWGLGPQHTGIENILVCRRDGRDGCEDGQASGASAGQRTSSPQPYTRSVFIPAAARFARSAAT